MNSEFFADHATRDEERSHDNGGVFPRKYAYISPLPYGCRWFCNAYGTNLVTAQYPPAPKDLHDRGRRFWRRHVREFEFSVSEIELLTEICRTLDLCEALEATIRAEGPTSSGHVGQPVSHPAAREIRQQRLALGRLLAQLDLPGADEIKSPTQLRAQKAARSRWDAQHAQWGSPRGRNHAS